MQVGGVSGSSLSSKMYIAGAGGRVATPKASSAPAIGRDPRSFLLELAGVRDAMARIERFDGGYRSRRTNGRASVSSTTALDLSVAATAATAATLTSIEQVNTIPTSWSSKEPDFTGSSTSTPTLGGTYDGSNGDDTLEFVVTDGGSVGGLFGTEVEVRDGSGAVIDTVSMGLGDAGDVFTLSNGLEVAFSSGNLTLGDSFTIDVFATVGEALATANGFDGTGDASANLDDGFSVVDGSFELNGETISVFADDSLDDVIARIDASGAGVELAHDSATDTVSLTQLTAGASETITIENDSSGLIAALKLDGAVVAPGTDGDDGSGGEELAIDQVDALSAIQSGTILVGGVAVSVDVTADSLDDVLDRIGELVSGASASYDAASGTVTIQGARGEDLELDGNGTGFFTTLGIVDGSYAPEVRRRGKGFTDVRGLVNSVEELARALDGLYEDAFVGFGEASVRANRAAFETILTRAFEAALGVEGDDTLRSGLGFDLVRDGGATEGIDFDRARFEKAVRRDPDAVHALLFATEERDGFDGIATSLAATIDGRIDAFERFIAPGGVGSALDVVG